MLLYDMTGLLVTTTINTLLLMPVAPLSLLGGG